MERKIKTPTIFDHCADCTVAKKVGAIAASKLPSTVRNDITVVCNLSGGRTNEITAKPDGIMRVDDESTGEYGPVLLRVDLTCPVKVRQAVPRVESNS